jgi:thiamine-monophosphate kinase
VGARVLGGDLARFEKIVIDVCALGTVERAVRRAGAHPGDGLWVTGALGAARLALRAFQAGRPTPKRGPGSRDPSRASLRGGGSRTAGRRR